MYTPSIRTIATGLTLLALSCVAYGAEYGAVSTLPALDAGIAQRRAAIAANRDESCGGSARLLDLLYDIDQFMRFSTFAICPSAEKKCVIDVAERLVAVDDANLKILKPIIARYRWRDLKTCGGSDAQMHAWLLVQHADRDTPFQQAVLDKMREAFLAGEVSGANYAYLVDRVATGEKKSQTFGTQGACDGNAWKPDPVVAPEGLDQRRHEVGLESEATYSKIVADSFCKPQPTTPRP
jgi:hypothetical protein